MCWDVPFEVVEDLEFRDVTPVESFGLGMEDFPLLTSLPLFDGDPLGDPSTVSLSFEGGKLGRLLYFARWTIVGSNCPIIMAADIFRPSPERLDCASYEGGPDVAGSWDTIRGQLAINSWWLE